MSKLFGTAGYRALASKNSIFNILLVVDALCKHLNAGQQVEKGILVSFDTRVFSFSYIDGQPSITSEKIAEIACSIIEQNGLRALLTKKPTPSPVLSWTALKQVSLDLSIVKVINITASHNRFDYVGIKLYNSSGEPENDETYNAVQKIINKKKSKKALRGFQDILSGLFCNPGSTSPKDIIDPEDLYIKDLRTRFDYINKNKNQLKIAVDYSFGSGVGYFEKIFADSAIIFYPIHNSEPIDSDFEPDTEEKNLTPLMSLVKNENCDFGVCVDTDGNKISFVDENGMFVATDVVIALLVEQLLQDKTNHGTIILTLPTTRLIENIALTLGLSKENIIYTDVGFKYVVEAMHQHPDFIIAAEVFGGATARGWINDSDAFFLTAILLQFFVDNDISFSKNISEIKTKHDWLWKNYSKSIQTNNIYRSYENFINAINVNALVRRLGEVSINISMNPHGLFINNNNFWMLVRPSGTENKLRFFVEINN